MTVEGRGSEDSNMISGENYRRVNAANEID